MGNRYASRKSKTQYVLIALLLIFLIAGAFLLLKLWERGQGGYSGTGDAGKESAYLELDGVRYTQRKNVETFLVLGLDAFEKDAGAESYNNAKRADFLLLLVLDHDEQKVTALQINRDTMVEMHQLGVAGQSVGKVTRQIALAHTEGNGREVSCRNVADAVSDLLYGTRVEHYMSLTMDSTEIYTDLLGGVTVTVLDDFSGIDDTLVKGETMSLTGAQALTYVRTRQGLEDSSNARRMERQEQVMRALYDATLARMEQDDKFAVEAILSLSEQMVSNRTATQLQELVKKLTVYEFSDIVTLKGESRKGEEFMEFTPDEKALRALVIDLLFERAAEPQ